MDLAIAGQWKEALLPHTMWPHIEARISDDVATGGGYLVCLPPGGRHDDIAARFDALQASIVILDEDGFDAHCFMEHKLGALARKSGAQADEKLDPDIICLQETKCPNDQFPEKAFAKAGFPAISPKTALRAITASPLCRNMTSLPVTLSIIAARATGAILR